MIEAFEAYFRAQKLFGVPRAGQIDYTKVVSLDLGTVTPSLAGPKRPKDRIEIGKLPMTWQQVLLEWQRDWARAETAALLARHFLLQHD